MNRRLFLGAIAGAAAAPELPLPTVPIHQYEPTVAFDAAAAAPSELIAIRIHDANGRLLAVMPVMSMIPPEDLANRIWYRSDGLVHVEVSKRC